MPKGAISKKESRESKTAKKVSDSFAEDGFVSAIYLSLMRILAEQHSAYGPIIFYESDIPEKQCKESLQAWRWDVSFFEIGLPPGVERRLEELESRISTCSALLQRLHTRIGPREAEEQEETQQWPAFATEEFRKIVENRKALEDAGGDQNLILYHIMEVEMLLGRIERKARATDREYEARLAASLRDICRIHEPSELSDEQIKRFAGSLQALIEGWGQLNRDKVKWIRSRLLDVGLTWLPVTEKAQMVIDEAKSSVK